MAAPFKIKAHTGPIQCDIASFKDTAHAKVNDDAIRRILVGDEALEYLRERHNYSEVQLKEFLGQQLPAVCVPRNRDWPTPNRSSSEDDVRIELSGAPLIASRAGVQTLRKFVSLQQERALRAKESAATKAKTKASQSQKKPSSPQSIAPCASTDPVERSQRDKPFSADTVPADSNAHQRELPAQVRELAAQVARRSQQKEADQRKWKDSGNSKSKRIDTFASMMGDTLTTLREVAGEYYRSCCLNEAAGSALYSTSYSSTASNSQSSNSTNAKVEFRSEGVVLNPGPDEDVPVGTTITVVPNQNSDGTANIVVTNSITGEKQVLENIRLSDHGQNVMHKVDYEIRKRKAEEDFFAKLKFHENKQLVSGGAYLCSFVMNFFFLVRNILICVSGEHRVMARKKLLWPIFQQIWVIIFNILLVYFTVKWWWFLWDIAADLKREWYGTEAQRVAYSFQQALTSHVRAHVFATSPSLII